MGEGRTTHIRYLIVAMLFIASCFSYGDRVALSIAGTAMQKELALDPVKLGWLLSGFGWAYVLGQLPSGGLLDRFGSKRVYGISIVAWSLCAFLIGFTRASGRGAGVQRDLRAAAALGAGADAGVSRATGGLWRRGFRRRSGEGRRRSSMRRSTLRWWRLRRCLDG